MLLANYWGGVLQQSNISAALKVVCAIAFLYCLPVVIKHITKSKLVLIFTSVLVILINLLVFDNNQFTDTILTYSTMCLTGYLAADSIGHYSLLRRYLLVTSRVIAGLGIIIFILSLLGAITSLRTGGYRMGLGYACITGVMFLIMNFSETRKLADLVGAIGLIALIFVYGSRGPLIGIILFAVYFSMRYFHKKGQDFACVILFIALVVFVVFFRDIMSALNNMLIGIGVSSRSLYLLANQSLSYDAGRSDIWQGIIEEIQKNPFRIRGINAEYMTYNTYAHNMILELIYQHGIIVGGFALFFSLEKVIETIRLDVTRDEAIICLIFMFSCIPSLMFSGSLWTSQNFWIWIAIIISISQKTRGNSIDSTLV